MFSKIAKICGIAMKQPNMLLKLLIRQLQLMLAAALAALTPVFIFIGIIILAAVIIIAVFSFILSIFSWIGSLLFPSYQAPDGQVNDGKVITQVVSQADFDKYTKFEEETKKEADKYEDGSEFILPAEVLEGVDGNLFAGTDEFCTDDQGNIYSKDEKGYYFYVDDKNMTSHYATDSSKLIKIKKADFMADAKEKLKTEYAETEDVTDTFVTYTEVTTYNDKGEPTGTTYERNVQTKKKTIVKKAITWEGTITRTYEKVISGTDAAPGPYSEVWEATSETDTHDYTKLNDFVKSKSPKMLKSDFETLKDTINQLLNREWDVTEIPGGSIPSIPPEKLEEIKKLLPTDLAQDRYSVVTKAYELLGKVNYFWGGKSEVIGMDDRWGTPTEVTAPGSRTTGTTRPFGLDCSGFVYWAFNNALPNGKDIGHGTETQIGNSKTVSAEDLLPGDLVFIKNSRGITTHVGIVVGRDSSNNIYIIHENSSANNISVTGIGIFNAYAQPKLYK